MLKKLSEFIVNKRKVICIVFLILAIAAIITAFFVKINYDMSAYLPKDSETAKGMEIMNEEFGDNGTLSAMISDVTIDEAIEIKKQIEAVKNVESVIWLDDALLSGKDTMGMSFLSDDAFLKIAFNMLKNPSSLPAEIQAMLQTALDSFYKDNKALYQITFTGTAYDDSTVAAIKEIKEIKPINMTGPAATSYAMQSVLKNEILMAVIIIVPILILLLLLVTSSYFDIVIFIAVLGFSVILNMGTNIILGSVSYLTNSVAILLQVAISMDYAIFFLHSFKDEKRKGKSPADSAKAAFRKSFSPISASSLTTIASFVAMLFMRYTIGFDMGLVLGKGIIISLLTVFLFMPGFVVMTNKAIEKGEHKSFLSLFSRRKKAVPEKPENSAAIEETHILKNHKNKIPFKERFAGGVIKARYVFPVIFALLILPAYFAQRNNNFQYGEMATAGGDGSLLQIDRSAVEETFGSQNNAVILLSKQYNDKEFDLTVKLSKLELDGKKYITSAQSYSYLENMAGGMGGVPDYMVNQFISENYTRIILTVDTDEESEEAFLVADEIRRIVSEELGDNGYYLIGSTVSTQELKNINKSDFNLVTLLTLVFIMLILIITFRGLALPAILGIVIQSAIWFGMALPFLLNEPLVFLGYLIVSCVQMGATIDYGILLSSHYTENRKTMGKIEAAKQAFLSSIGPVTTSASILALVGFSVSISGMTAVTSSLGLLLARGTIISYLSMMFILPQLLVIFDKPIKWTTLKFKRKNKKEEPS